MDGNPNRRRFSVGELTPSLLSVLGGLFAALYVVEQVVLYRTQSFLSTGFLVGLAVSVVFIVPLVGGGYLLRRSDLSRDRYARVAKWTLGGAVFFLGVNLPMIAIWSGENLAWRLSWGRWAASVGAAAGMLIGYVEARAIQRELAAQRAAIRAQEAENKQQWLDYLNGLLRHEVLNTANVIAGYASLLLEDDALDEGARAHLETIHRQGEDMTEVIRDVKVLIEATKDAERLAPQNLADVLVDELDQLRDVSESVTVDASMPDDAFVLADELLPRVFSNLLRNAVEHHDGDDPTVRVTVERGKGTWTVHVADDGPGIPPSERDALFERSDNTGGSHGLGLYLVRTLIDRYGGTVELAEAGPDGSRFTVELPAAEPTSSDAAGGDARPASEGHGAESDAPDPYAAG